MLIPLTRGQSAIISEADAAKVLAHKWHAHPIKRASGGYYASSYIGGKTVYLHRFLLNAQKGQQVDHISGDGLDNRRENIRICTAHENCANVRSKREQSGLRGIYRNKAGSWGVQIWAKGQYYGLGNFQCLNEAREARNAKVAELHGEFGRMNTA